MIMMMIVDVFLRANESYNKNENNGWTRILYCKAVIVLLIRGSRVVIVMEWMEKQSVLAQPDLLDLTII